jgi:uncharacterized protein YyaL (SSP411 family)
MRAVEVMNGARALEIPAGGFYDGKGDFAHAVSLDDGVEPSGTAALARALVRLETIEPHSPASERHASIARALGRYGNDLRARGLAAAAWLDAALLAEGPTYDVVIAGSDVHAAELLRAHAHLRPSWSVLARVPEEGADPATLAPLPTLANKRAPRSSCRAFVCERGSCEMPTSDARTLSAQLLHGWRR